jgi:Flp pilus assembly protein TadG
MARERQTGRRGATAVECAFILGLLLLFIFGLLEYGRYAMMWQLVANAAREGARYAVVHTYDSTVVADTRTRVVAALGGQQSQFDGFNPVNDIRVFHTDDSGTNLGPATDATFGQAIAVEVTGRYRPIIPSLYVPFAGNVSLIPDPVTITSRATMNSEAN